MSQILPTKNGPYKVTGPITLYTPEGKVVVEAGKDVYLCRCGHSSHKPYCDGTHAKVNFEAEEGVGE